MKKEPYPIDFVIPWVDGNDPAWQAERAKYDSKSSGDNSPTRFRDWDILHFWFRGVEKFAPWVNKIHFITWGHLPEWLNTDNPKLHIVNHKDYIPEQYLPTFSSHPIELNMHRIEGLAEHFVYFNDDMFLTRAVKETDFFRHGLPCDSAIMKPVNMKIKSPLPLPHNTIKAEVNDMFVINHRFNKKEVLKKHWRKFFNVKYGKAMISTILMLPYTDISGFYIQHLPASYRKSIFERVWQENPEILDITSSHKFRFNTDVNQWLFQYYQFCLGMFEPVRIGGRGKCFEGSQTFTTMLDALKRQKYKMVCCNDSNNIQENFDRCKEQLQHAFESILPEKSSFERN